MDFEYTRSIAAELAQLAQQLIENGRFPFRKAEDHPRLLSPHGELTPPLVLWINRDSFMAGGIILLHDQSSEACLEYGGACAEALGLQNFVTWTPGGIEIWQISQNGISQIRRLDVSTPQEMAPTTLHKTLQEVLEELKPLSIIGAVPPEHLGAYYLANLCLFPLIAAQEELIQAIRSAHAGKKSTDAGIPSRKLAESKGVLVLARLLALMQINQIPENVQPEKLERAFELVLFYLPGAVATSLAPFPGEPPLPYASAVRFHHLFRRLGQLRWGNDQARVTKVLEILLRYFGDQLELETESSASAIPEGSLLVNPAYPREATGEFTEAYQDPAFRALSTLLRHQLSLPPAQGTFSSIFDLQLREPPKMIEGTLTELSDKVSATEKELFRLKLRTSWPNRRLSLSAKAPGWMWETAHLLGLAAEGAVIRLSLPANWLIAGYGNTFYDLITEQFSLLQLSRPSPGQICLCIIKKPGLSCDSEVYSPFGVRTFSWRKSLYHPKSFLLLALSAPASVLELLESGKLRFDEISKSLLSPLGVSRFLTTSLGSYLWKILAPGHPLPRQDHAVDECSRHLVPLPFPALLQDLENLEKPNIDDLQLVICAHLGDFHDMPAPETFVARRGSSARREKRLSEEETAQIISLVFKDGVPRFPENYLYDFYRPELQQFALCGTIQQIDEFLGVFELTDSNGDMIRVEGEETARALELAAFSEQPKIELPVDRHLTATIVEKYLSDLKSLRHVLLHETHRRRDKPRLARHWARRIWESLPLPPWDSIDGE